MLTTPTHSHSHTYTHSLLHKHTLSCIHTPTRTLSHPHTHSYINTLTPTHSHPLTPTHSVVGADSCTQSEIELWKSQEADAQLMLIEHKKHVRVCVCMRCTKNAYSQHIYVNTHICTHIYIYIYVCFSLGGSRARFLLLLAQH
jgi:hypothetical protein